MTKRFLLPLIVLLLSIPVTLFAGGEKTGETAQENQKLPVFVVVQPQQYFVERIGGQRVSVEALVQPGRDPHTYDPSPQQVARLTRAKLLVTLDMPFEAGLIPKIRQLGKQLVIVDSLAGLDLLYGAAHYHYAEDGTAVLHGADEPDPHVWLGPREVRHQIRIIKDALIQADPAGKELYEANYKLFDAEIAAMHKRFETVLAPYRGKSILVFHPAYAYFTNTYGIIQRSIELDGKAPSPRHLERMIDQALQEGAQVVFTQPEFSAHSAELIARAIGGTVFSLNPLEKDWPALMEKIAAAIAQSNF